jgi:hypothetical protein
VPVQKAQAVTPGAAPLEAAPAPEDKKPAGIPVSSTVPFFAEGAVATVPPSEIQPDPLRPTQPARFPRHVLSYNDVSFDGKPVDVQLVTTILPDQAVLFIIQESSGTDTRAITAINSLRPLP